MTQLFPILVLTNVVMLSFTLRTSTDGTPAYYQNQTYVNALDQVQRNFQTQIKTLNQQINEVNAVIRDANQTTSVKVTKISQKMADERNQLYNVQQLLKIPYRLKICQCRVLAPLQKTRLQDKVVQIKNNISNLQQAVSQCTGDTCANYKYIQEQVKNMKSYLASVEQILNSDCCHKKYQFKQEKALGIVDLGSNVLYKDNLRAKNWYYGSTNEHDYKFEMFQLTTKYNISTCPLQRPFANYFKNRCQKCQDEGAVFNLGVRACFYCGKLAYLNQSTSLCDPCPTQQFYNYTISKCQSCPIDNFLNTTSQQCEPCPTGQFWDSSSGKCTTCPQNSEYDQNQRICRTCNTTAAQYLNTQTSKCQSCPNRYLYNINSKKCELCPGNAFFNKTQGACVACKTNFVLNKTTGQCQPCTAGSYFNSTMGKCVACPNGSRFDNVLQQCIVAGNGTNITIPQNTTTPSTCPSDHPHYNTYLKQCQACPVGKVYEPATNQCIKNTNIGICPNDRPFYDISTHSCVSCTQGTTFNFYTYTCVPSTHHRHTLKM